MEFVWLTINHGLNKFDDNLNAARLKYQNYVLKQECQNHLKELREGFSDGQILGDDNFLEGVRKLQNETSRVKISIANILDAVYQVYGVDLTALASPTRSDKLSLIRGAAALLAKQKGLTVEELANVFKRDGSSLGRLLQRFSQRHASCINLQNQYQQFQEIAARFADLQA